MDYFSKPISFSYKKEESFTTAVGGCISILIAFGILGFLIPSLFSIFANPKFELYQTCAYKGYKQG